MAGYRSVTEAAESTQKVKDVKDAFEHGVAVGRAKALGEQKGRAEVNNKAKLADAIQNKQDNNIKDYTANIGKTAGGLGGKLGKGVGNVVAKLAGLVNAALPVILPVLASAAAIAVISKVVRAIDTENEKNAAKEVNSANKTVDEEIKKTTVLNKNYTRALELSRKGLAKTEEETEEYQKLLSELNEVYPQLVEKGADGLYKLTKASDEFYQSAIKASNAAINAAHTKIKENAKMAGGAGIYIGEKGTELNEEVKSVASILSEQTQDAIKMLGNSNFSVKVEDITKMSEQGLTREAINEFVVSDYMTNEFEKLMDDYVDLVNKTKDGIVNVDALGYRNKEALTWFNAINAQYGTNLIGNLWEQTYGNNIMKAEITNWAEQAEAETGNELPDKMLEIFNKLAQNDLEKITSSNSAQWNAIYAKYREEAEKGIIQNGNTYAYSGISGTNKNEVLNKYATQKAQEWAKSYTGDEIVEKYKEVANAYLSLQDKTRENFDRIMTNITEGKVGLDEQIENLIKALGLSDEAGKKLADPLKKVLDDLKTERNQYADELIGKINAKTGREYSIKDFSQYTNDELEFFSKSVDKTYGLYGQEASADMMSSILDYYDKVLQKNEALKSSFANIDFFDANSIAQYGAQVLRYGNESNLAWTGLTKIIDAASNATDRATKTIGEVFSSAANSAKELKDSFDMIENGLGGNLDMEDAFSLLSNYGDIIDINDLQSTGEGFKLNIEDATRLAEQMLQIKINEYRIQEAILQLKKQELADQISAEVGKDVWEKFKGDFEKYVDLRELFGKGQLKDTKEMSELGQALKEAGLSGYAEELININSASGAYRATIELLGKTTINVDNGIKNLITRFESLSTMLEQLGEYSDVDSYIEYLESNNVEQKFIREFSSDPSDISDATKQEYTNYGNLISANLAKADRATVNTAKRREALETQYGDSFKFGPLVGFDEHGNVQTNEQNIMKWAEYINDESNFDLSTEAGKTAYENEKKNYNLFFERIKGYKTEHELIAKSTQEAQKYTKEMEALTKDLRKNVVDLEQTFLDLFIERDEKALESLKERYDSMKEMDNDYLNSVRDAVDKERKLRDRKEDADDLAKMERQLELLRMSGGSATEIQSLEEDIRQARQDMADQRQDDMIDEIAEQNEERAKNMDDEIKFQEMTLKEKKENMILYNQELATLMNQDKETIMNTWKELDTKFQSSTAENKKLLEDDMDAMVSKGKSAKELLADENGYVPKIEDAYKDVKKEIGNGNSALEDFVGDIINAGKSDGEVVKSIGEIENGYLNVESVMNRIIGLQPQLSEALSTATQFKNLNVDTSSIDMQKEDFNPHKDEGNINNDDKTNPTTLSAKEFNYTVGTGNYRGQRMNMQEIGSSYTLEGKSESSGGNKLNDFIYYAQQSGHNVHLTGIGGMAGDQPIFQIESSPGNTIAIAWDGVKKIFGISGSYKDFVKQYNFTVSDKWASRGVTAFATGGMVDYTGPAWVDGTKSKPEAFLSANDTQLIASLRDILRTNPKFGTLGATSIQKNGDTYYEIHINVDELGDGYSVDDLMEELEERIVQATDKNTVIKVT